MVLASAWYSPSSDAFWADLIALVVGIATIIVARQALPKKRRLRCTTVSRSRLMNAPQEIRDDLEVSYKSQALSNPYVVALEFASTGRSAIPTDSFDNGRGLQL
jgi:hypothetical protein